MSNTTAGVGRSGPRHGAGRLLWLLTMAGCAGEASSDASGDGVDTQGTADASDGTTGAGGGDDGGEGSSGCGTDPAGLALTLQVGGGEREFELYLPGDYDASRAYPLVLGLHGGGGTASAFRSYAGLEEAVGADAIVVYPEGLFEPGTTAQVWDLDPSGDDFVFFDALLGYLSENLCIDGDRVFATGWSMGGYMANGLGCYRSGTFRAIASCSGGTPGPKPGAVPYPACEGQVPAMVIHGSADSVIPLSEGQAIRDTFVMNNGCAATTSPVAPSPCVSYNGCEQDTRWCEFSGDHVWPDFARNGVWDFFRAQ